MDKQAKNPNRKVGRSDHGARTGFGTALGKSVASAVSYGHQPDGSIALTLPDEMGQFVRMTEDNYHKFPKKKSKFTGIND